MRPVDTQRPLDEVAADIQATADKMLRKGVQDCPQYGDLYHLVVDMLTQLARRDEEDLSEAEVTAVRF